MLSWSSTLFACVSTADFICDSQHPYSLHFLSAVIRRTTLKSFFPLLFSFDGTLLRHSNPSFQGNWLQQEQLSYSRVTSCNRLCTASRQGGDSSEWEPMFIPNYCHKLQGASLNCTLLRAERLSFVQPGQHATVQSQLQQLHILMSNITLRQWKVQDVYRGLDYRNVEHSPDFKITGYLSLRSWS